VVEKQLCSRRLRPTIWIGARWAAASDTWSDAAIFCSRAGHRSGPVDPRCFDIWYGPPDPRDLRAARRSSRTVTTEQTRPPSAKPGTLLDSTYSLRVHRASVDGDRSG
jgi:hypothetical protein